MEDNNFIPTLRVRSNAQVAEVKLYLLGRALNLRYLLTPSRPEDETAGNARCPTGRKRNETAVQIAFCLVKAGFESP